MSEEEKSNSSVEERRKCGLVVAAEGKAVGVERRKQWTVEKIRKEDGKTAEWEVIFGKEESDQRINGRGKEGSVKEEESGSRAESKQGRKPQMAN